MGNRSESWELAARHPGNTAPDVASCIDSLEMTQVGLLAARARGRFGGRPKAESLNTPTKVAIAQVLCNDKRNAIKDICKTLRISRATLYRSIQAQKQK